MATVSVVFLVALISTCLASEGVNFAGELCQCRVKLSNLINQKCDGCINKAYLDDFTARYGWFNFSWI